MIADRTAYNAQYNCRSLSGIAMISMSRLFTYLQFKNATMHSVTDRQTDRQADDITMPRAEHRPTAADQQCERLKPLVVKEHTSY